MIRFIQGSNNIDFINYSMKFRYVSVLLLVLSVLIVSIKGINLGIDFTGGIIIELESQKKIDVEKISLELYSKGFDSVAIQRYSDSRDILIKLRDSHKLQHSSSITYVRAILDKMLNQQQFSYKKVDYIGPQIEFKQIIKGFASIACAFVGIFCYLWNRFNLPMASGGILALFHDVVLTMGFVSFTNIEFNLASMAALLTIIGYSINDSVVIYDRIRQLLKKIPEGELIHIINTSLNSTLSRTILTSFSTLLATIPLIIFCKDTVRELSIIMFFGILVGTYSSIFISAPVLLSRKIGIKRKS